MWIRRDCFLVAVLVIMLQIMIMVLVMNKAAADSTTEEELQQVASSLEQFVDEIPEMPKVYGYSMLNGKKSPVPKHITIGMFQKKWKFHKNLPLTTVFAYGTSRKSATIPGPTIEAYDSVPTYIRWENHLPTKHILPWDPTISVATPKKGGVPTVVHLHGGIQEPQSDGSAQAWFTANFADTGPKWTKPVYTYPNQRQLPGNLWYHDHAMGLIRVNLLAGLIGVYTIRNPKKETKYNLPIGEFDRHLVIFDRSFNKDGSLYINRTGNNPTIHPQWQPEYFGDAIIVNGKAWPYMKVERRRYRFRIINTSNARFLNLSLSNGLSFTQVASDSSYLPAPVKLKTILVAPSEIADIVVDFSKSKKSITLLKNTAPYPYPDGDMPDSLTGNVMKFIIKSSPPSPKDTSSIPSKICSYMPELMGLKSLNTRYIVLYEYDSPTDEPTHSYINGKHSLDPATETPKVNSTEIWKVINLTPDSHPLHVHLAVYQAIEQRVLVNEAEFKDCMTSKNDAIACNIGKYAVGSIIPVPENEKTWKNVIKMSPGVMTTVVIRFGFVHIDVVYPFDATAEPGYVYHCHILDHEDNEMVRPLKLVK